MGLFVISLSEAINQHMYAINKTDSNSQEIDSKKKLIMNTTVKITPT